MTQAPVMTSLQHFLLGGMDDFGHALAVRSTSAGLARHPVALVSSEKKRRSNFVFCYCSIGIRLIMSGYKNCGRLTISTSLVKREDNMMPRFTFLLAVPYVSFVRYEHDCSSFVNN